MANIDQLVQAIKSKPANAFWADAYRDALLAVLDKCDQMRVESKQIGWAFAETFEGVIGESLGKSEQRAAEWGSQR